MWLIACRVVSCCVEFLPCVGRLLSVLVISSFFVKTAPLRGKTKDVNLPPVKGIMQCDAL